MPFRPRRLILPLVVIAAVAGALYWWNESRKAAPVSFRTVTVTRGTLTQNVTASGGIQPVATVDVSSQISGLIQEVFVDYNSRVKAGDVLARLDPATYENRLRQAEAELANTQANHQLVRLNAERIRSLHERNLVSQQELDQAEAQLAQADAQLLMRKAAVETAKVDLNRCTITAPIDGLVLDRPAIAGKTISASTSAPVLFVLVNDLREMQINASVAEADISNVREGQQVNFTVDAYPGQSFRGTVRQIRNNPVREQNVVSYVTIIDVRNDDLRLKPGMTADVSIVVQERHDALLVGNAALRARVPEELVIPADTEGAPASAAPATQNLESLLKEVGHTGGRPTAAVMERVRALAAERGIVLPERRGRRGGAASPVTETTRTVYLAAGTPEAPRARAVIARFGITDGVNTEVLSGLSEGDQVITNVITAEELAASGSSGRPAANPFGGGRQTPRRF
jgi:RND family efflux transporter, MFP subunit